MTKLQKYVKTIVNIGVNIQKDQRLVISCPVDFAYFGRALMEEAYKAGAGHVLIRWSDRVSNRIEFVNAPDELFAEEGYERAINYEHAIIKHLCDGEYALIGVGGGDPELFKGVDTERLTKAGRVGMRISKPFSDRMMSNKSQWCAVTVPSEAWAKKVFPEAATDEDAVEKLWDAIYAASRIDDNDPVENWKLHVSNLNSKVKIMNSYDFAALHLKNSLGTNLRVELADGHRWVACGEESAAGVEFIANIPTEELFTAPKRTGVNGVAYGSKPLVYMGDLIENFHVEFKDGKAVKVFAEKNQHLLEKLISTEENADYLGEIALVPHDSPISNSGILFYNTLYDENASCHLAFGKAYASCVANTEGKSEGELNDMGVNQSLEHTDFMVGSADMEIIGITKDGKEITVFENGNYVF